MRREAFYTLTVSILAALPVFAWLILNKQYPRSDAGQFAAVYMHAYGVYLDDGFLALLKAIYFDRMWKPIFFSHIGLPAIFAVQSFRISLWLTLGSIYMLISAYIFRIFRLRHGLNFSFFLTLTIMSSPFILSTGIQFMGEGMFVLCIVGFILHSYLLIERWSSYQIIMVCFWFALGLLIRPVEGIICMSLPMIGLVHAAYRLGKIKILDVLFICCLLVLQASPYMFEVLFKIIPSLNGGILKGNWLYGVFQSLPFVLGIMFIVISILRRNSLLASAIIASVLIVDAWYKPFGSELVGWIYECTFGVLAHKTGGREGVSLYLQFARVGLLYGLMPVICFVIFALSLMRATRLVDQEKKIKIGYLFLAVAILPIFIGAFTFNGDPRYYMVSAILLVVGLGFYIDSRLRLQSIFVTALFIASLAFNYWGLAYVFGGVRLPFFHSYVNGAAMERPNTNEDTGEKVNDFVFKSFSKTQKSSGTIAVMWLAIREDQRHLLDIAFSIDPWRLSLISEVKRHHMQYELQSSSNRDLSQHLVEMRCNYDLLLIGPTTGVEEKVWDWGSRTALAIIEGWKTNKLVDLGLEYRDELVLYNNRGEGISFLLLATVKSGLSCSG